MHIRDALNQIIQTAMQAAGVPEHCQPHVTPAKNAKFGDYQANGAMAAAKALKTNPRELATNIIAMLPENTMIARAECAGPGFINLYLSDNWIADGLQKARTSERLLYEATSQPQNIVVDYSSPNLAKEMHVGHLRSTIIGDAVARVLEFQGHNVIRQNHVGDWGTQFGMLIAELEDHLDDGQAPELALQDLETFYQQAKKHFDKTPGFADKARDYVVQLQSGEPRILQLWTQFREVSLQHSSEIYQRLNVTLSEDDVHGESAYNPDLPDIVTSLQEAGLATENQGAQVVFLEELADKEGNPSPVIVQKQDGGYLYSTSDLAALRYRANVLNADRILYFIDARQSLHMKQVFLLARKANFVPTQLSLEHHAFGTMMGPDGKPFKTRSGGTVKLAELLDEAVERARALVEEKATDLSIEEKSRIAEIVGIGAVKYADLSKTRTNDYIFNWKTMLSFEGNTAPYLQYAVTRVKSIFRKIDQAENTTGEVTISDPHERALALQLLQFGETLDQVAKEAFPHILCSYLYDLASLFMRFYETCPILKADVPEETRSSRLSIAMTTAKTLEEGLNLLGIETSERM